MDNCPQNCVDISCDQNSGACVGDCTSGFISLSVMQRVLMVARTVVTR